MTILHWTVGLSRLGAMQVEERVGTGQVSMRYSVWEENVSATAHQTAQRVQPDLILLDIAMPETDDGKVAARIESDPTLHRTPVVFLAALVTKARDWRSTQMNANLIK